MIRRLLLSTLLFCSPLLFGHAVSLSTGELRIEGARAAYELRMPLYEAEHIANPARDIFANISFSDGSRAARTIEQSCRGEAGDQSYRCVATYEFEQPPEAVTVRCTYYSITVPNHIHVLKATKDGAADQAVLDLTFNQVTLKFDQPGRMSTAVSEALAGGLRAISGTAQVLFLAALVLAARSRRELMVLAACFLAAQIAAALVVPNTAWNPVPRFVEAAAALSLAYLAVEILFFPGAGQRWAIVLVLGAIHGLYFALLLRTTGYHPVAVLGGAAFAQLAVISAAAAVWRFSRGFALPFQPARIASWLMLVAGLGWFVARLRG